MRPLYYMILYSLLYISYLNPPSNNNTKKISFSKLCCCRIEASSATLLQTFHKIKITKKNIYKNKQQRRKPFIFSGLKNKQKFLLVISFQIKFDTA